MTINQCDHFLPDSELMKISKRERFLPKSARKMIWIGLGLSLILYRGPKILEIYRSPTGIGDHRYVPDCFQDYASARNILEGRPAYTDHNEVVREYIDHDIGFIKYFSVNAHPPSSIPLFLPLAYFGFHFAYMTWGILSTSSLLISLLIVRHELGARSWPGDWISVGCFLLVIYPFQDQIKMGQTTALILLLLTGAWAFLRSGRPLFAGILIGIATCIKLYPGVLLIHLALTHRWRSLAASIITIVLIFAMTATFLGVETFIDYFGRIVPLVHRYRVLWPNASLVGFWSKLFDSGPEFRRGFSLIEPIFQSSNIAIAAESITAAIVLLALFWTSWRVRGIREGFDMSFATTIVACLLLGPLTWSHSLLLLLLAIPIFWSYSISKSIRIALVAIAFILAIDPRFLWSFVLSDDLIATPRQSLTVFSLQFYALALLFAIGIGITFSQRNDENRILPV